MGLVHALVDHQSHVFAHIYHNNLVLVVQLNQKPSIRMFHHGSPPFDMFLQLFNGDSLGCLCSGGI